MVNTPRLIKKMDELGLDGIVATTLANVYYLTGIQGAGLSSFPYDHQTFAVLTRAEPEKPVFITSKGLSNQALDGYEAIQDVVLYGEFFREDAYGDAPLTEDDRRLMEITRPAAHANAAEALAYVLEKLNLQNKKIGVDEINLKPKTNDLLRNRFAGAKFENASAALVWVRKVKTAVEVEYVRRASQVNEAGIKAAMAAAREGMTEYEMVRAFEHGVIDAGGFVRARWLRFGPGGVAAERRPNETKLVRNQPLFLDLSSSFKGYQADFGRVGVLGEPSERVQKVYAALLAGHKAAIEQIRPGMTGAEGYKITVDAVKAAGLTHYRRHHVGHGIGIEVYEDVLLAPGVNEVIEEGTIVNAESPYYEFGLGGLIVEDPFVVRAGGNELLTTLSQELLIA